MSTELHLLGKPPFGQSLPGQSVPEEYHLAPEKLLKGNPLQQVWLDYTDASGKFFAGTWRSEPGRWRIRYTEEEYCELLAGVSRVASDSGEVTTLHPGDRFVIPRGFSGTWEVMETTTKRFVIYEPGN